MLKLVWLVPFFPLLGFIIVGLGRNVLGKLSGWIASLAILASFIVSIILFNEVMHEPIELENEIGKVPEYVVTLFNFIHLDSLKIPFNHFNISTITPKATTRRIQFTKKKLPLSS